MELFVVRNRKSLEVLIGDLNNKMEAKRIRDEKNGPPVEGEVPTYVISLGKDHRNFKGAR
jgi:hypothetical protein